MGPGQHSLALAVNGVERRCLVQVPRGYDGSRPLAVVLMFHGAGGTAELARTDTGWGDKADQAGFLAVFPEGMRPDPSRPPTFRTNPQFWDDGSRRGVASRPGVDDVGFVKGLLDDLPAHFPIDPRRIFVTGFSNGAALSFLLAAELSRRIAAVAPVAGPCWLEDPRLERPVPTIYLIGTQDPLVPLEGGEVKLPWGERPARKPPVRDSILRWAQALGCPAQPRSVAERSGVRVEVFGPGVEGAELRYYTVEGLGHFWPGGPANLPERLGGKPSDRLQATDVIWEFFEKHPLG